MDVLILFDLWKTLDLDSIISLSNTCKEFRHKVYDNDNTWIFLAMRDYNVKKQDKYNGKDNYIIASMNSFVQRYRDAGDNLVFDVPTTRLFEIALEWAGHTKRTSTSIFVINRYLPIYLFEVMDIEDTDIMIRKPCVEWINIVNKFYMVYPDLNSSMCGKQIP